MVTSKRSSVLRRREMASAEIKPTNRGVIIGSPNSIEIEVDDALEISEQTEI